MSIRVAFVVLTTLSSVLSAVVTAALVVTVGHATVTGLLITRFLAVAILLVILSLWIGYAFAQPIRRRLYEIEEAAVLLASGRLHHRVTVMGRGDEIDQLGVQFNEMGEKLQAQVKVLQGLAAENEELNAESERGAVLEERQRLARELHDSVSQQLFALTMLSATAARYFTNKSPQLGETLTQIDELANGAQREMRALLLHLRPVELDGRTLQEACNGFLNAIQERHGLQISFTYKVEQGLSAAIEQQLFRILQEAVANVLKHAQASSLQAFVTADPKRVEMTILDDGIGIEEDNLGGETSYGLRSMRERAVALGGTCDVWRRDNGTAVRVSIPRIQADEGEEKP